MTYLAWDESRPCVLACPGAGGVRKDAAQRHAEKTVETVRMNRCRFFRHAMVALIPAAAISLGLGNVLAQTPPPAPPAVNTPAPPAPAPPTTPSPAQPAAPAPGASSPAAAAETPAI